MPQNLRLRRIARAIELRTHSAAAGEVLDFLIELLKFGDSIQVLLEQSFGEEKRSFCDPVHPEIVKKFSDFLSIVEVKGPDLIASEAKEAGKLSDSEHRELLTSFWTRPETATALVAQQSFLVRAFLQPYAEFVRGRSEKQRKEWTPRICPFCLRKPCSGVLRPLGDGGQRFLVCSFCLGEWEFRRIVCPACGEESELKLAVYSAEEFNHVRVECCDSCRCYIKTVDLTKNGLADPVVDEVTSIPLDLWAQARGYSKLETNLMML